ncbi:hypothetical protein AaE_013316 [Aphanomyces astaci]|uniref:Uncharacterized protein n=1 Tax=Aphanomyces astaci TaxID=112090 RepID=A0A6A4ZKJ0_APHAT|nr:hypothetical protein AaE_013316 [Aphanomyces astaci]
MARRSAEHPIDEHTPVLEKHWPGLVTKYPHCLGPVPIATAASGTWLFRPFTMAEASETATGKWPPYPGETTTHRGLVRLLPDLSQSLDDEVRQDFVFPPRCAAISPCELPLSGGGRRTQGAPSGCHGGKRLDKGSGRGSGSSTASTTATYQATHPVTQQGAHRVMQQAAHLATQACGKAVIPPTPVPTMAAIVTTNGAVPLIVSRPPATAVAQATGTVTTTKTAAPTKTTRATPHRDQTPSAALPVCYG